MSEDETKEKRYLQKELKAIHGKPNNIQIDALKTIEAYDKAYNDKKVAPTSKRDYPRSDVGFREVQRLLQFDAIVKPEKGIKKVINSIIVQPVTIEGKRKYALYMHGQYIAFDAWDNEIGNVFSEGYYYKPKLQFVATDRINKFDPSTGELRGSYKPAGKIIEHTIFIPEAPKERKKWLDDFTKDLDISNCQFSFRQPSADNLHSSMHSTISYEILTSLTFDQITELTTKNYYKDDKNRLRDKDNILLEYDPSTNKLERTDIR
jgi:hypothetical protein